MRIGPHSRVVRLENQRELVPTIRRSFADVPRVANACKLLVQIKDEDWGGEFVEFGDCGHLYEDETEEPEVWIECSLCSQWFHCSCEGLSFLPPIETNYICLKCQK